MMTRSHFLIAMFEYEFVIECNSHPVATKSRVPGEAVMA
jgi:hypothetical protein